MSEEKEDEFSGKEFLMPRFNTLHFLAKEQIDQYDSEKAKESYHRMVQIYNDINASGLRDEEKQAAYQKLTQTYNMLSSAPQKNMIDSVPLARYLFPVSFIIIVMLIIFFVKPELSSTGFAVLDTNNAPEYLGQDIVVEGNTAVDLDGYFTDDEGDDITYIVTGAPNIDVSVSGSILTINPSDGLEGLRVIKVIASDMKKNTKTDVNLIIK